MKCLWQPNSDRPPQTSNDDYIGLNGETSWILVTNHFSRMKHGDTRVSKASPINCLRDFLEKHAPACSGKYVFMDQGGELYNNPEVRKLFTRFGYNIRPTGAAASNQNALVERGHLVVANTIRALLLGANLPIKFWLYAFHFWLRIDNSMASRDQLVSPNYITTGKKDDLSALRTFGCRVWVRPPGRQPAKLIPNSCKGIFLGFTLDTDKNIIWYDTKTHVVKIAKHVRFDEGMNNIHPDLVPPNVVHLQHTRNGEPLPAEAEETSVDPFTFHLNPFSYTMVKGVQVTDDDPLYGLTLTSDELSHRSYVTDVKENSTADKKCATHKSTLKNVKGAFLVGINGKRVFGKDKAISMLRQLYDERAENLQLELAIELKLSSAETWRAVAEHNIMEPSAVPDVDHHHQLTLAGVHCISAIRYPHLYFSESSLSTEEMEMVIQAIQSQAITPAEQAIGRFTRRKLCTLSTWEQWRSGEHKQLDRFHDLKMYGEPVRKPPGAIVLRPHWQHSIKGDGTRRSRNCCDGSPQSAPLLNGIASTYSSCVEQPVQQFYFALAARENYRVYGGDAQDAYAHSPPPETPTFISIGDAYADWYEHHFKKKLDRSLVLPVLHALQGHPESG